jgi:hypothetical protein
LNRCHPAVVQVLMFADDLVHGGANLKVCSVWRSAACHIPPAAVASLGGELSTQWAAEFIMRLAVYRPMIFASPNEGDSFMINKGRCAQLHHRITISPARHFTKRTIHTPCKFIIPKDTPSLIHDMMSAPEDSPFATLELESTTHIPIAELSPNLETPASRSLKAIVTLTWPFSSATGVVAFLLAEPDFRLRRSRGQVRVQFAGSCARRVANSHIASGDEVHLSLDGVEWVQDGVKIATPGRGVEFELRFTERVLLKVRLIAIIWKL